MVSVGGVPRLAAFQAAQQGGGGFRQRNPQGQKGDEKGRGGKPFDGEKKPQRGEQKPHGKRAGVPHKDPRRRKVEDEKGHS